MVVELIEVLRTNKYTGEGTLKDPYILRKIYVNSQHVVCLREDEHYKQLLSEGRLMDEIDRNQSFTKIYLNRGQAGIDLTVVGSPSSVQEKLGLASEKQLLRG